jgi:hypothetical protein
MGFTYLEKPGWFFLIGIYLEDTLQSVKSQRAFSKSITPVDVSILSFENLASVSSLMGICQV